MKLRTETRIAVRPSPDTPARKLTKVVTYKNGGFAVLMPYHQSRSGFLAKMPVDYNQIGDFELKFSDVTGFTAKDRVKLSYHPDGFAQFSGEISGNIVSGRNSDGSVKGVGLMTSPLTDPIRTGPTFGITAWGLEQFDELSQGDDGTMIFEETDCYYRGCTPGVANGWMLEAFVFPARYWAGVRACTTGLVLKMAFAGFEASGAVIEMRVIELPGQDVFIAAFVSRAYVLFAAESGWVLSGPGTRDRSGRGEVISAFYPRDTIPVASAQSIDR